jgi:AcrR family transcriptional regulator
MQGKLHIPRLKINSVYFSPEYACAVTGLRERKKQATRRAIHDAGMRLFAEQGYAATTIDQIAEAANVSRATVFGYFAAKEDIVFGDAPAAFEHLRASLVGQDTITAFRAWLVGIAELGGWFEPELAVQLQLAEEVPAVGARRLALHRDIERIVADALLVELGPDRALAATLAAAALIAAVRTAEETAAERIRADGGVFTAAEVDQLLGEAMTFARAGLAAL